MQSLTPQGQQLVADLARRYGFGTDAVMALLQAVAAGGGTMAQFNHPEFGGGGQWMQGGMIMVGDMFNQGLKARVDSLCGELSQALVGQSLWAPPPPSNGQYADGEVNASLFMPSSGSGNWWPGEFGAPGSSGAQNNIRYAVFPAARRLAIDAGGQVTVYDTLDHQIGGVSQQQGYGSTLNFTSQHGLVRLEDLPVVAGGGGSYSPEPEPESPMPMAPMAPPASVQEASSGGDIFTAIERLADLRQKGILTDGEFAQKKAELLSRI